MPLGPAGNIVLYAILAVMIAIAYWSLGGLVPNTVLRAIAAAVLATVIAVLAIAAFYAVRGR